MKYVGIYTPSEDRGAFRVATEPMEDGFVFPVSLTRGNVNYVLSEKRMCNSQSARDRFLEWCERQSVVIIKLDN